MHCKHTQKKNVSIFIAALILWGCGESSDSTNNAPSNIDNSTGDVVLSSSQTSSILCNEGETFTDGIINYICSNQKWIQQETTQQCTEGQIFRDGTFDYICSGGQWILLEQPTQVSNSSSSVTAPIEHTNSSSYIKAKSSSSNKEISSSSSVSTGCKYERETRYIYFDDLYIADVCINGVWKYPSTSCEKKGASFIETLETSTINGISYTSYCSNNTLHFNKTCKEGDRDTITQNGTIEARVCTKYGIWSTIVSLSSSSQQSSASQQSSSSFSYQKCFNPNIQYGQMKDSRDGHIYKTVVIGSQTWMAENLNYLPNYYANYINTYEPLTNIHNPESKLFGCSDGLEKNCDITGRSYGKIVAFDSINYHDFYFRFDKESPCYNYTEFGKCYTKLIEYVTNKKGHFQGICPSGWHIPTTDEFTELLQYTHTGSSAGSGFWDDSPFKSTCQWPCYYKVGSHTCYNNGTDEFGFSLIPTGIYEGPFDLHSYTHLWYITSYNGIMDRVFLSTLYRGGTLFGNSEFGSETYGRGYVRCVKD